MSEIMIQKKLDEAIHYLNLHLTLPIKFKETIIEDIHFILSNYYDSVDMIVLFGSCGRGNPRWDSDVDILILSEQEMNRQDKTDIRAELCEIVDRVSSDVIFYTFDGFKSSRKRIVDEIKKEGVILWKKD